MFVAAQVLLDLSFPAAGLEDLARGGLLTRASQGAYGDVWVPAPHRLEVRASSPKPW